MLAAFWLILEVKKLKYDKFNDKIHQKLKKKIRKNPRFLLTSFVTLFLTELRKPVVAKLGWRGIIGILFWRNVELKRGCDELNLFVKELPDCKKIEFNWKNKIEFNIKDLSGLGMTSAITKARACFEMKHRLCYKTVTSLLRTVLTLNKLLVWKTYRGASSRLI